MTNEELTKELACIAQLMGNVHSIEMMLAEMKGDILNLLSSAKFGGDAEILADCMRNVSEGLKNEK